jgi:positive regulator of sigma E activity
MYIVPLMVIVLLAIVAVAWSPIFAVIIFAIFFALFLAYVGLSRRADQGAVATPEARAAERGRQEGTDTRIR